MIVVVNIEGVGTVTGQGEYETGSQVSLSATPGDGNSFRCFLVDGKEIPDNPYSFEAGLVDVNITAQFFTTIEDYLTSSVGFPVTGGALNNIRIKRGITYHQDVNTLSHRTLELAYADVLMWGANSPTTITGAKDSDGGWSHQEESRTMAITDKKLMRSTANDIYKKYNDEAYTSSIKFVGLTGKPYYGR